MLLLGPNIKLWSLSSVPFLDEELPESPEDEGSVEDDDGFEVSVPLEDLPESLGVVVVDELVEV